MRRERGLVLFCPGTQRSAERITQWQFRGPKGPDRWAQAQPGAEGSTAAPFAHVDIDLRDNEQYAGDIEAYYPGQIYSADALQ